MTAANALDWAHRNILHTGYRVNLLGSTHMKDSRHIETSPWWSAEQLRVSQWEELRRLLDHAYRIVPYCRRVFEELGMTPVDVQTPADSEELPLTGVQRLTCWTYCWASQLAGYRRVGVCRCDRYCQHRDHARPFERTADCRGSA